MDDPLGNFSPQTADWFRQAFPEGPTPTQVQAWPAIRSGGNALIISPTGSGKTLAAFLCRAHRQTGTKSAQGPDGHPHWGHRCPRP